MNTNFAELNARDIIKSAITAAIAAAVLVVYNIVGSEGFNLFTVDWVTVGQSILNASVAAFIADVGRRFFTDQDGKLFGAI